MAAYEFTVTVKTQYLEEQSDPSRSHYVFAYAITIVNTGTVPAQLISRHWVITDANNHVQEVRGLGVVGHQPSCSRASSSNTPAVPRSRRRRAACTANISAWPRMATSSTSDPGVRAFAAAHLH
jgi:hypothetical protein